jgi:hypothetical protein
LIGRCTGLHQADQEVHTYEALMLISGYGAYVFVMAIFKPIMKFFCPVVGGTAGGSKDAEFYVDFDADQEGPADVDTPMGADEDPFQQVCRPAAGKHLIMYRLVYSSP